MSQIIDNFYITLRDIAQVYSRSHRSYCIIVQMFGHQNFSTNELIEHTGFTLATIKNLEFQPIMYEFYSDIDAIEFCEKINILNLKDENILFDYEIYYLGKRTDLFTYGH